MKLRRKLLNKLKRQLSKHELDKSKTNLDSYYNCRRNYMRGNQFM